MVTGAPLAIRRLGGLGGSVGSGEEGLDRGAEGKGTFGSSECVCVTSMACAKWRDGRIGPIGVLL